MTYLSAAAGSGRSTLPSLLMEGSGYSSTMAEPVLIQDPADPRIRPYLAVRDRDLVGRDGHFMIEGEVVLRTALRLGRYPIASLLIAESKIRSLADLIASLPSTVPVYAAPREILDRIVGFPLHRGILAIGLRDPAVAAEALLRDLPPSAIVMVVAGLANHDNMGGLFRNAAAFGVNAVLLDATCCDPLYRKSIRVSAGAALIVPFAKAGSVEAICDLLAVYGFEIFATSPRGREQLTEVTRDAQKAAAILFGAEGSGLPRAVLEKLRTIRIGMVGGFESLNVATASGIVLHHLKAGAGFCASCFNADAEGIVR